MNFLKKFIKNTKTDNKVTLNDFISSFKFNLESSSIICNTQLSKPPAEKFPASDTVEGIPIQDSTYRDSFERQ